MTWGRLWLYGAASLVLCVFALLPLRALAAPPAPAGSGWVQVWSFPLETPPAHCEGPWVEGCVRTLADLSPSTAEGSTSFYALCYDVPGEYSSCEGAVEFSGVFRPDGVMSFTANGWVYPAMAAYVRVLYATPPDGSASSPEGPSPATETAVQDVRLAVERATPYMALSAGCLFVLLFAAGYRMGADLG